VLTIAAYDTQVEQLQNILERLAQALTKAAIPYRIVGGMAVHNMPETRSVVHIVESENSEPVVTEEGVLLAPVADLVRMKLTSFRLRDQVHIQDLDSVRLITREIEESLQPALRERLAQVRRSR